MLGYSNFETLLNIDLSEITDISLEDPTLIYPDEGDPRPKFRHLLQSAPELTTLFIKNESSRLKLSIWAELFDYLKDCPKLFCVKVGKHDFLIPQLLRVIDPAIPISMQSESIQYESWWTQEDADFVVQHAESSPGKTVVHFQPLLPAKDIGWLYDKFKACPNVLVAFDNASEIKWEELNLPPDLELMYDPLDFTGTIRNAMILRPLIHVNVVHVVMYSQETINLLCLLTTLRHLTFQNQSNSRFEPKLIEFVLHFLQPNNGQLRTFRTDQFYYESQKSGLVMLETKGMPEVVELNALELDRHLTATFETDIGLNLMSLPDLLYPEAVGSLLAKITGFGLDAVGDIDFIDTEQIVAWSEMLKTVPIKEYCMWNEEEIAHPALHLNYIIPALKQNPHLERVYVPFCAVLSSHPEPTTVTVVQGFKDEDITALVELANRIPIKLHFNETEFPSKYQPLLDLKLDSTVFQWSPTVKGLHLGSVVKTLITSDDINTLLPVARELVNLRKVELEWEDSDPELNAGLCQLLPQLPQLIKLSSTYIVSFPPELVTSLQACESLTCLPMHIPEFASHCLEVGYLPRHLKFISPESNESDRDKLLELAMRLKLSELEEVRVTLNSIHCLVPELLHNVIHLRVRHGKQCGPEAALDLVRAAVEAIPHIRTLTVEPMDAEGLAKLLRDNLSITSLSPKSLEDGELGALCARNMLRQKTLVEYLQPKHLQENSSWVNVKADRFS